MMQKQRFDTVRAIEWNEGVLKLLDQRRLPQSAEYIICNNLASVADAIRDMVVRGAPAIGVAAAYGVVLAGQARYRQSPSGWKQDIAADLERLGEGRTTGVKLCWAIERMKRPFLGIQ